ncbi:MAG: DnaB-like helicase N-terminal domain-containing protein [Rickettsiales bacterium]
MSDLRIPPHSEDAESGALGSILLDPSVIYKVIDSGITAESFFDRRNSALFEAMVEMHDEGRPFDALTFAEKLKNSGKLDMVGGYEHLSELQDYAIVTAHVGHYCAIVLEKHRLRLVIEKATDAIQEAYKSNVESGDLSSSLALSMDLINNMGGQDERTLVDIANDLIELDTKIISGEPVGLPFPWSDLQKKTHGIPYSAVSPLTGRDGRGKSRLATFLAVQWSINGIPGLYFPFEDTELRCLRNAAASFGEYDAFGINNPYASPDYINHHKESIKRFSKMPLNICDSTCSIERIISTIAIHHRKSGIKWVIIDGFKDISSSGGENRTQEEVRIMRQLTACARKYGVAIIPVMHINKIEDERWISKQMITGSGDQTKSARMVMVYQDYVPADIKSAIAPDCYDEGLFILDIQKASYGDRALMPLIKDLEHGRFCEVENEI